MINRVLVTGSGGYIGTVLVPMLLSKGHRVRAVDRFYFGRELLQDHPALEIVREDVRRLDPSNLDGVDAIIDLAGISNDPSGELFRRTTWEVNCEARVRLATMARSAGVRRYLLASTCSIYGFQEQDVICSEEQPSNPLTTYAKANEGAEAGVLPLADDSFTVVVLRQATAFGFSPRMRFDLAINGMTYGAWKTGKLPVLRDGTQYRPMVHVADTASAHLFMLEADRDSVNGEVFNVGANANNYRIGDLARLLADRLPREIELEWYGTPDRRSYRVNFDKIAAIGFRPRVEADAGALEVFEALETGRTAWSERTITLDWYRRLIESEQLVRDVSLHGGMLEIDGA